jgi:hypothetical protein
VVDVVNAAMSRLDQDQCVLLVAHSNAGLFMPLLVTHAVRPIRCCLFVDAALPARTRQTSAAPNQLLAFLRGKVNDGMPWATEAAADPVAQRARGREAELHWDQGSDYSYVLRHSEIGAILGMFGLHRRVGPTALEIGYWLHPGLPRPRLRHTIRGRPD